MSRNIISSDTDDLAIAPTTECALCVDGFFSEMDSGVQHLAARHSVDAAVMESAAKLVLSQVQRHRPVTDVITILKAYAESSGETERIDPKSNKAKLLGYVGGMFLRRMTCTKCPQNFERCSEAAKHMETTPGHYVSIKCHKCAICGEKMPTIPGVIYSHAQARHGINLLQYQKLYFSETPGTKEMRSGCLFSCNMCGEFTGTHEDEFKRHLRRHHDTSLEEYSKKNRTSVHAKSLVRCVFCDSDRPIRHSAIYLKAHSRACDKWIGFPAFFAIWKAKMEGKPWPNLEAEGLLPSKFRPRVTMPDNVELKKNRLIKKKDKDNDMEEDSDEEMLQLLQRQRDGSPSDESTPSRTVFNQVDRADDGSEDSDKEMMDFMARKGVTLSRSGAKKRRMPEAYSRPMPKAARIKLEMKMEAEADAEEGPDSDEEMMALLDPSGNGTSATDSRNVQLKQMMDGEVGNNNSDSEDDVANMITEGWGNRETR